MRTPPESSLGKKVRKFRLRQGLTQQEASDLYGCSLRWWQNFEQGRNVTLQVLIRIGAVIKVDPWKLLK